MSLMARGRCRTVISDVLAAAPKRRCERFAQSATHQHDHASISIDGDRNASLPGATHAPAIFRQAFVS
jgi:hypothetical protein